MRSSSVPVSKSSILVTGGLGYLGRHLAHALQQAGYSVITMDRRQPDPGVLCQPMEQFVNGDIADSRLIGEVLEEHGVQGVVHLAADTSVGESMAVPLTYHRNNVSGLVELLVAMEKSGCRRLVFASSAAVYGNGDTLNLLHEELTPNPINPYGWTKAIGERILGDAAQYSSIRSFSMRIFNVAGMGERTKLGSVPSSRKLIIPLLVEAAHMGRKLTAEDAASAGVFGRGYPTCDGTVVRDYVHPDDVARSIVGALEILLSDDGDRQGRPAAEVVNVGTGQATSLKEIIEVTEAITGHMFGPIPWTAPTPGFPVQIVPDCSKARTLFGLSSSPTPIQSVIQSAWDYGVKSAGL